jgi:hypothetical protein
MQEVDTSVVLVSAQSLRMLWTLCMDEHVLPTLASGSVMVVGNVVGSEARSLTRVEKLRV